jgi:subtilisin family serine protease
MRPVHVMMALLATAAAMLVLSWNGELPNSGRGFVTQAQAIIGRPLTPLSYAGVARRTSARAYAYGATAGVVAGAAAVNAYAYPPGGCVQVVNAYGQVITRCR